MNTRSAVLLSLILVAAGPLWATPSASQGNIEELIGVRGDRYAVLVTEHENQGSYYVGFRTQSREVRSVVDNSVLDRVKLLEVRWNREVDPEKDTYGQVSDTILFEAPPEVREASGWEQVDPGPGPAPPFRSVRGSLYVGAQDTGFEGQVSPPITYLGEADGYWYLAMGEGVVMIDMVEPRFVFAVRIVDYDPNESYNDGAK